VPARVIVVCGPSGSGKSLLCARLSQALGLPAVNLDDFYKDGSDPTLPRRATASSSGIVDWDDPASWSRKEAVDALDRLCREGSADVPVYDIAHDGRTGVRPLSLGGSPYVLAEGLFAQEIVADCRERGLLADAVCVRNHRAVTFWRRLARDLREHRKPPLVLLRRGWRLMRIEPEVVAHAVACGARPMTPHHAFDAVSAMVGGPERLLVNGRDVAPVTRATTARTRSKGLLGRTGLTGALWLWPARQVHTFGMRFPIDVAHLDASCTVIRVATMPPGRVGAWVRRGRGVVEAEQGAFEGWQLRVGDRVELGDADIRSLQE
jgi:uridine kinase